MRSHTHSWCITVGESQTLGSHSPPPRRLFSFSSVSCVNLIGLALDVLIFATAKQGSTHAARSIGEGLNLKSIPAESKEKVLQQTHQLQALGFWPFATEHHAEL